MYYEKDRNLDHLDNIKVAILGSGSQGHAHALNLRDSGVDVIVGLRVDSKSREAAEELGLTVERATGLERIESAEFARTLGGEVPEVGSAWRFVRPDFDLTVRAEVLLPRVEAVLRNQFRVGFDQVSVAAHADYTISRAGVFV